ncbi:MAG TPA: oligopeptide ABC transporter permease [Bacillales bacterium]
MNQPVKPTNPDPGLKGKPDKLRTIIFRKFVKNKLAVGGAIALIIIILAAIFAPFLTRYEPADQVLLDKLLPPSSKHLLGTDQLGRDTFSRLLFGARVSLLVGFASMFGAVIIGTIVGAVAGYFGGIVDAILMRIVDIMIAFPAIFLFITLVTIFQGGLLTLIEVFAFFGWMGTARLVRGEFLSLRSREYVLAAKTMGIRSWKIIFSHVLPNAIGPIIVAATLQVGIVILAEAVLSFLGLGISPPTPSWGNMLEGAQSLTIMLTAWWYPIFPGVMVLITVLSFNFVGDGLRDALDPKVKE